MAILDIFKKKKEIKKEKVKKEKADKEQPKVAETKEPKAELKEIKTKPKVISGLAYKVLKSPHVTEKATELTKSNQYVFKVWPQANKPEIKRAVEEVYGVDVEQVSIINVPRKKRRLGRIEGWRKGYKKAIVKIKEGQKIEVMPH